MASREDGLSVTELAIGKLSLKPGDILVVRLNQILPDRVAQAMKNHIEAITGETVLLLGPNVALEVISKA